MNIFQKIESFFGIGGKPATPMAPSQFQSVIDETGKVVDTIENSVNILQPFASIYPPLAGYLSAIVIAVHALDSYVDTLETPAPVVAPSAATPK